MVNITMASIRSCTEKKQIQTHFILDSPLPILQSTHLTPTPPKPNIQKILQEHQSKYNQTIRIPEWQELLWAINIDLAEFNPANYPITYSTSYEAQAIRQGLNTPIKPLGIAGLVRTNDHFFIYGLRTGVAMGGYLCNAPAGHCSPEQTGDNILYAGFLEELETELGVTEHDISNTTILGFQNDPDFGRGINVVIATDIHLPYAEIQQRHQLGRNTFLKAKEKGFSHNDALEQLKNDGIPNIDAHEHDLLVAIPSNIHTLQQLLTARKYTARNQSVTYPIMDIAKGSLIMHLHHTDPQYLKSLDL